MATKAQIRDKALTKLGVLAPGATASSEAADSMTKAYNEVYASLEELTLTFFPQDNVPDSVADSVAALCAWSRVSEFLVSELRYQRVK